MTIGVAPVRARYAAIGSAIGSATCCQSAAMRSAKLEEAKGMSVADPTAERRSWRRVSDGMGVNGGAAEFRQDLGRAAGAMVHDGGASRAPSIHLFDGPDPRERRGPWPNDRDTAVADLVQGLTRESAWKLVETVPMKFTTYHPQGMVKIGDVLVVSSVEVRVEPAGSRNSSTATTATWARVSGICSRST